ncbi:MAG: transcription elongation factor Spt5 [Candidatus Hodarchaeaceae archaeon]|nr:transcription elongation factor Spt5 [Candidatus Hodarchaeaceae archaeon]
MEGTQETRKPAVFAVRTTIGQEKAAADMIATRARNFNLPVKAVLAPEGIRGYVFVEALEETAVEQARAGIKHAKGVVEGEIPFNEIEHFLTPKPVVVGMEVGDIVELISGPFRGERARIIRVDELKEEITVELFEATVPIPVTVRGDFVKVIEKTKRG